MKQSMLNPKFYDAQVMSILLAGCKLPFEQFPSTTFGSQLLFLYLCGVPHLWGDINVASLREIEGQWQQAKGIRSVMTLKGPKQSGSSLGYADVTVG